jgi:hypothetical protein
MVVARISVFSLLHVNIRIQLLIERSRVGAVWPLLPSRHQLSSSPTPTQRTFHRCPQVQHQQKPAGDQNSLPHLVTVFGLNDAYDTFQARPAFCMASVSLFSVHIFRIQLAPQKYRSILLFVVNQMTQCPLPQCPGGLVDLIGGRGAEGPVYVDEVLCWLPLDSSQAPQLAPQPLPLGCSGKGFLPSISFFYTPQ